MAQNETDHRPLWLRKTSPATPRRAVLQAAETAKKERPALTVAGAAVGRRKQAIARVRIVPGTGKWTINGRELANYFPNKLHQQDVNEPFKILDLDGAYDVIARIHGGGISGQAGALRLGIARSLNEIDPENNRADPEEGRLPAP